MNYKVDAAEHPTMF